MEQFGQQTGLVCNRGSTNASIKLVVARPLLDEIEGNSADLAMNWDR